MKPLVGRVIQGIFLCFFFFYQAFGTGGENDGHFGEALVGGHFVRVGGVQLAVSWCLADMEMP